MLPDGTHTGFGEDPAPETQNSGVPGLAQEIPAVRLAPSDDVLLVVNETVTFAGVGGSGPYLYEIALGIGTIDPSSGLYTAPAIAGVARVRATDSRGRAAFGWITVADALALSPATAVLNPNETQPLTPAGGFPPYVFTLQAGTGTVGVSSGVYTAPAAPGSATVRVTDVDGNTATAAITVQLGPTITPATLALAVNNSFTFAAASGTAPYTFSIIAGGGTINGVSGLYVAPAAPGSATIRVLDSVGDSATATVTVNAALAIAPSSVDVPSGDDQAFTASGGVPPYAYSVESGGGSVDPASGLYSSGASGAVTVRVTDDFGNTADAAVTVYDPLAISPASDTILLNAGLDIDASGGVPPYAFSVFAGAGSVNPASGLYTAPGAKTVATVRVTDDIGGTADAVITVNEPLRIDPTSYTLAAGNTFTFAGEEGVPPYAFSVFAGGGSVNPASGLYTAPGASGSATVRVTDDDGATADATVTINDALQITPSSAIVLANDTALFGSTGGVPPISFSLQAGPGNVDSGTGIYNALSSPASATVRATDSIGNTSDAAVTVIAPTKIAAGYSHACSLFSNGSVKCWGLNDRGQLGYGDTASRGDASGEMGDDLPFVDLGTGRSALDVAAGSGHTCALLDNDGVKCWGRGDFGQLGYGDANDRGDGGSEMGDDLPSIDLGTNRTAVAITAGETHNCAILDDGSLKCWGRNQNGQLGYGDTAPRGSAGGEMGDSLLAVDLGTNREAVMIDAGGLSTCAVLDDDTLKCWGSNTAGNLGVGDANHRGDDANEMGDDLPVVSLGLSGGIPLFPVALAAGESHTCAILDDGSLKCWGLGSSGQLGTGDTASLGDAGGEMGNNLLPVDLGTGLSAAAVTIGQFFSCALLDDESTKCWGLGTDGQLGTGDTASLGDAGGEMGDSLLAVELGTGRSVASHWAGETFSCAILDNAQVKCFGLNASGQLGIGAIDTRGDAGGEMGDDLQAVSF